MASKKSTAKSPKYVISVELFKGKPIFTVRTDKDDKFPVVSFGVAKATAILDLIPQIEAFVKQHATEVK
jgi:hypothetical protein